MVFRWCLVSFVNQISFKNLVLDGHNDPYPFDGPGNSYAHAFYPPHGEVHFDADEKWDIPYTHCAAFFNKTISPVQPGCKSLFRAAVHEIGHSLGLKHSSVSTSIMYPTISLDTTDVCLDDDDIAGIQHLAGITLYVHYLP